MTIHLTNSSTTGNKCEKVKKLKCLFTISHRLYQTADGKTNIDVKLENETVWLTQDQLAILFERDKSVNSRHINNIIIEGELDSKVVAGVIVIL